SAKVAVRRAQPTAFFAWCRLAPGRASVSTLTWFAARPTLARLPGRPSYRRNGFFMNAQPIEPLIDLHCHLLPGIDDGPGDWSRSWARARMAVEDGIGLIVAPPHQLGGYANRAETIRQLTAELNQRLARESLPLRVVPGADVRIEPDLPARLLRGEVMSLA